MSRLSLADPLDEDPVLCCLDNTDQASYCSWNSFSRSLSSDTGSDLPPSLLQSREVGVCSLSPAKGGLRGRDNLGLGLAGLLATPPAPPTATVNSPVPRRGSLGLHSDKPTLTDKEEAGSDDAGDTNDGFPADAA
jgi:hypothetical protein